MAAGLIIGLVITVTLVLGGWLYLRRRTQTPTAINPPGATPAASAGEAGRWPAWKTWGLTGCVALIPLALFCGWRFWLYQPRKSALLMEKESTPANAAGVADPQPKLLKEYYHSFKADADLGRDYEFDGPDADECVRFEPAGLRLNLPAGHPGKRIGTGLVSHFGVKGDFEITLSFEMLQEPAPADAGNGTGLYLGVETDTPELNRAMVTRGAWPDKRFYTWFDLSGEDPGDPRRTELKTFPARGTTGRLRLVRTGSLLSHYAAEGDSQDFTLLRQLPFRVEDLKGVRVGGQTGGANAALEARVTDLRIRAGALPGLIDDAADTRTAAEEGGMALALAVTLATTVLAALGMWLYLRPRRRPETPPAGDTAPDEHPRPEAAAAAFTIRCSTCGKKLKARAELAGKRVKCPQCGQAVLVPSIQVGAP